MGGRILGCLVGRSSPRSQHCREPTSDNYRERRGRDRNVAGQTPPQDRRIPVVGDSLCCFAGKPLHPFLQPESREQSPATREDEPANAMLGRKGWGGKGVGLECGRVQCHGGRSRAQIYVADIIMSVALLPAKLGRCALHAEERKSQKGLHLTAGVAAVGGLSQCGISARPSGVCE